jgi:hypothetical protein
MTLATPTVTRDLPLPATPTTPAAAATAATDASVVDLNERLKSLDMLVRGLSADVASLAGRNAGPPQKQRPRQHIAV